MIYYVNYLLPVYEKVVLDDLDIILMMNVVLAIQLTFNCSKSTIETLKKCLKYVGLWPQACNFLKIETLAQVFSCEFCVISKNTFFTEHLRATASVSLISSQ